MTECLSFRSINPIAELFYLNPHVFYFPSHFLLLFISNCSTKLLFVQNSSTRNFCFKESCMEFNS